MRHLFINRARLFPLLAMGAILTVLLLSYYDMYSMVLTFGRADLLGGNNCFDYPALPADISLFELGIIISPPITKDFTDADIISAHRRFAEQSTNPRWLYIRILAREYYEFGDYTNSLSAYEELYASSGLNHFMDLQFMHQFASLLIASNQAPRLESIVREEQAAVLDVPGLPNQLNCVAYYHQGNYLKAFAHYLLYKFHSIGFGSELAFESD